jgi:hypothetical protein
MRNLGKLLGGPGPWIKRDDFTGLAGVGNKARKLEFLMGDALAQGTDSIITRLNKRRRWSDTGALGMRVKEVSHGIFEKSGF